MLYISLSQSLNGEESLFKNCSSRIRIRIFTKIESVRPCHTLNLSTTFFRYPVHKQTNKQTERGENITSFTFDGGGFKKKGTIYSPPF